MISRHTIKMLIGLLGMGVVGLIFMFLINMYEKQGNTEVKNDSVQSGVNSLNKTN